MKKIEHYSPPDKIHIKKSNIIPHEIKYKPGINNTLAAGMLIKAVNQNVEHNVKS